MGKYKYGLKLWSNNNNYINEAKKLHQRKVYDYIELYIVPGSYDKYVKIWHKLDIPFIIHCTHSAHRFNLAQANRCKRNLEIFSEVRAFCDELKGKYIIFHPGIKGKVEECIKQINLLRDKRLLVENKPYISMSKEPCRGSLYQEINKILDSCDIGFCLDISHAFNTAYHIKVDEYQYTEGMLSLSPKVIHISDGRISPIHDKHLNIGQGDFDFSKIKKIISLSKAELLTLETCKNSDGLATFIEDIKKVKNILNNE